MTSNTLRLLLIVLCFFCLLPLRAISEEIYLDQPFSYSPKNGVLSGGVSATKNLPKGFYGTWQVVGEMIDTNNPNIFKPTTSDIWTLEKDGDKVILRNPSTGAIASITVNEVEGNTAIFTRKQDFGNKIEYEQPKLTLEGDNFTGTNLLVIEKYIAGKMMERNIVKYNITGRKISGPTLKDIFSTE